MTSGVLLLDATYRPLRVIPVRRAVGLMLKGRAEGVTEETIEMRSASDVVEIPLVLRLGYVLNVPFRHDEVKPTRRGILARDEFTCQFVVDRQPCNRAAESIDHVYPRALGGEKMSWTNLVASCNFHNHKKGMRTIEEMGWKLKRQPFAPKAQMRLVRDGASVPAAWEPFLSYA